jgi:hypothetical protein
MNYYFLVYYAVQRKYVDCENRKNLEILTYLRFQPPPYEKTGFWNAVSLCVCMYRCASR